MKLVAIVAMLVEHWHRVVGDGGTLWPYLVGRLAFPLFVVAVAYNAVARTRDPIRFAVRLAMWGFIAQVPWMLALGLMPAALNVLFTLSLGAAALLLVQRVPAMHLPVLLLGCMVFLAERVSGVYFVEFGSMGVLAVVYAGWAFDAAARGWWWRVVAWTPFVVCIAMANVMTLDARGATFAIAAGLACLVVPVLSRVEAWRVPQLVGYAVYPAHLVLFALIARIGG